MQRRQCGNQIHAQIHAQSSHKQRVVLQQRAATRDGCENFLKIVIVASVLFIFM